MPTFAYSARDNAGAPLNGTLVAESAAHAGQMIRAEGKYPTSIRPAAGGAEPDRTRPRGKRMSRKDLIHVGTQLAIMIDTGVTLSEALECIARKPKSRTSRKSSRRFARTFRRDLISARPCRSIRGRFPNCSWR